MKIEIAHDELLRQFNALHPYNRGNSDFEIRGWHGYMVNGCNYRTIGSLRLGYSMEPGNSEDHIPELRNIANAIGGELLASRIFCLFPGAVINPHIDAGEVYIRHHWTEVLKVHIPIITNEDALMFTWNHGHRVANRLRVGEAWILDGEKYHASENMGNESRWHAVLDFRRESIDGVL